MRGGVDGCFGAFGGFEGYFDPVVSSGEAEGFGFFFGGHGLCSEGCLVAEVGFVAALRERRVAGVVFTYSAANSLVVADRGVLVRGFVAAEDDFGRLFVDEAFGGLRVAVGGREGPGGGEIGLRDGG